MYRLIEKLHLDRYVSSRLILALDLLVSAGASIISLLVASILLGAEALIWKTIGWWLGGSVVFSWIAFVLLQTHKSIIRHATLRGLGRLSVAVVFKGIGIAVILALGVAGPTFPAIWITLLFDMLLSLSELVIMRVAMVVVYDWLKDSRQRHCKCQRILIYGTGDKGVSLVTQLQNSQEYQVIGFLTYGKTLKNHMLADLPVYYFETEENVKYLHNCKDIDAILFAHVHEAREEQERLIHYCTDCNLKVLIAPSIDEVVDGKVQRQAIREIRIEDLLGREEIKISMNEIIANFRGKTILVTGAAGAIGSELCRQLATFGVKELVLFDNSETPMHNIRLELEDRYPNLKFIPVIGDVRMIPRLDFVFRTYRPQVVFHAAAYKHVPLMELSPAEAIKNNVFGTRNLLESASAHGVERLVQLSTDKAVNPTNVMGATKRITEMLIQRYGEKTNMKCMAVRFGNVLGSHGSVIPLMESQIRRGGPVTVTHPDITRYFMTIPEAAQLVLQAGGIAKSGSIFVLDMGEPVRIMDLAEKLIRAYGYEPNVDMPIKIIGLRPGEKLYEELLMDSERDKMTRTAHKKIFVANVDKIDDAQYDHMMQVLQTVEDKNDERAVEAIAEIVPTYHPDEKNRPDNKAELLQKNENQAAG